MPAVSLGFAALCFLVAQLCLLFIEHPRHSFALTLPTLNSQKTSTSPPLSCLDSETPLPLTNGTLHPYPYFASFLTFTLCVVLLVILFCFAPQLTTPNQ